MISSPGIGKTWDGGAVESRIIISGGSFKKNIVIICTNNKKFFTIKLTIYNFYNQKSIWYLEFYSDDYRKACNQQ